MSIRHSATTWRSQLGAHVSTCFQLENIKLEEALRIELEELAVKEAEEERLRLEEEQRLKEEVENPQISLKTSLFLFQQIY